MGISRFYRWISERYPQINEEITDGFVPQFDNLYLDVNGIAHNSVNSIEMRTPNRGVNLSERGSPEIWAAVFRYINKLVYIARPKKLLYIAVDGVAPRAKMNQQRSRRFRSARDSEFLKTMEIQNSIDTTNNNIFDSNCITPGTTFMYELKRQLEFFVNYQLNNDPLWKDLEVILSGADVPGEGEHKIMDYIRCIKSQKDYNNNTRHCLYGLDADLIMLSLASHEPHFSLLREEIKFSGQKNADNRKVYTSDKFQFLHISILREYIVHDLSPVNLNKEELNSCFEYVGINTNLELKQIWDNITIDNERLIDDFIILGFIVGNDFLPHIPFHTVDQGLSMIIRSYKRYLTHFYISELKTSPWLLEDCGRINYINLLRFLIWHVLSEKEEANKRISNPEYWKKSIPDRSKNNSDSIGVPRFMKSNSTNIDKYRAKWQETKPDDFDIMRWRYYFVKMAINIDKFLSKRPDFPDQDLGSNSCSGNLTTNSIEDIVFCYLEGLQWVSYYYFRGVPSWRWYYPYRYAPFACDIAIILGYWLQHKNISTLNKDDIIKSNSSKLMYIPSMYSDEINLYGIAFRFIKGSPLQPFEQLMGVLPSNSKELLPKPFWKLFTNKNSPLLSFYPKHFEVDMEGVRVPWGGITLIPFIDESLLLSSITYVLSNEGFYDNDFSNFKIDSGIKADLESRYTFFLNKDELFELINCTMDSKSSAVNDSSFLSVDDKKRNQEGRPYIFYFNNFSIPTPKKESTLALYLPSIIDSKVVSETFFHPVFPDGMSTFPNFVLDKTIIPLYGFPNFCRIPFKTYYNSGINVFGGDSNNESIFCLISSSHVNHDFLSKLLTPSICTKGQRVRIVVDYPKMKVAELVSIKTFKYIVRPNLLTKPMIELNNNPNEFIRLLYNEHSFLKKRGITLSPSNYINIDEALLSISKPIKSDNMIHSKDFYDTEMDLTDPINCLVEARISDNSHISEDGEVEFNFSKTSRHYLLPLVLLYSDIKAKEKIFDQLHQSQLGNICLCVNKQNPYYGCIGTIIDETQGLAALQIPRDKSKAEQLQRRALEYALEDLLSLQWFSIGDVSKIVHKPLLNCLLTKCGLDDAISMKYMDNLMLFLHKLIIGPIKVKCNDNTLHDISMNLFKIESKQNDTFCLPLYSKLVNNHSFITSSNTTVGIGTPIVSNETVKSLIEYFELFPDFVLAIFKSLPIINQKGLVEPRSSDYVKDESFKNHSNYSYANEIEYQVYNLKKIHVKDIFSDSNDSKNQDFKFGLMLKILRDKLYRNLPFLSSRTNSVTMLPSTISRLEKLILHSQVEHTNEYLDLSELLCTDYYRTGSSFNSGMSKIVSRFGLPLGSRVIYINSNDGKLPFGTIGTVVSVHFGVRVGKDPYPSTVFDILLDETQINANNLNGLCSKLRGICIRSSECIPLLPFIQNIKNDDHIKIIKDQLELFDKKTEKIRKKSGECDNYWLNNRNNDFNVIKKNKLAINNKNHIKKDGHKVDLRNITNVTEFRSNYSSTDHHIATNLKALLSIESSHKDKYRLNNSELHSMESNIQRKNVPKESECEENTIHSIESKLKKILKIT